jgi:hypothetical protein
MAITNEGALLDRAQTAATFGLAEDFLVNCARRRIGPPFFRLSHRRVAYSPDEVAAWLETRRVITRNKRTA